MNIGYFKASDSIQWLGKTLDHWFIEDHMILKVVHNKISNRKSDDMCYHIFTIDGQSVQNESYPSMETCLIALALVRQGKSTDPVFYMAKLGDLT